MARFKARAVGLATVLAFAIGIVSLSVWQARQHSVQAAQNDSTYAVERGDVLYFIADDLGISVEALAAANGLPVNAPLNRQQKLFIPSFDALAADSARAVSRAVTSIEKPIEQSTAEPVEEPDTGGTGSASAGANEGPSAVGWAAQAAPAAAPLPGTYTVKAGDMLVFIAKEVGVSVDALAAANGLRPNSPLNRGQVLIIPGGPPPAAAAIVAPPSSAPQAAATPEATEEVAEEATPEATEEMTEEATAEAAEEATEEATEEAMEEATPEATEEMTEEATPEANEEATEEAAEEAIAEAAEEVAEEAMEGATPDATEEMAEEATPEATEEMTEEATAEAAEEATEEATEEAMEEATPEATEEAAEEATEEPTAEATEEATAEPTEEATPEPTEEMTEDANILETLEAAGDFGIFISLLEAANLSQTLTIEGPFTLFAPTDAAFDALPAGTVDALLAASPDELSQILLYHLVPGEILSTDLADGATIVTAQGGIVDITVTPSGIEINGAKIITPDIETTNGVIHTIDSVLLPTDDTAAVPRGTAAPTTIEAASDDAASVIIVPVNITDTAAAAQYWDEPDNHLGLFSPVASGGYHSPISIIGLSNTHNGLVAIRLIAGDGKLLAQRMTLGGAEQLDFFQSNVRFNVTSATTATLNILEIDIAEGSILHSVDTPITLIPGQRVIDVNMPTVGQILCDPILASGYSSTFEANVVLTLSDASGAVLTQLPTMGGSMGSYRDFATTLPYSVNEATPLLVSFAEIDASGNLSTIDETIIPVLLNPADSAACQ